MAELSLSAPPHIFILLMRSSLELDVRYWHIADVPLVLTNVGLRGRTDMTRA